MDKVRNNNPSKQFLKNWWLPLLVIGVVLSMYFSVKQPDGVLYVDQDTLLTAEVKQGAFVVEVQGSGLLKPSQLQWVSAQVDGRVKSVFKRAGDLVVAGDVILEMENPGIEQQAEEMSYRYQAVKAETQALEARLKNDLMNSKAAVMAAQFAFDRAALQLEAELKLRNGALNSVSEVQFKRTQLNEEQTKQSYAIELKKHKTFKSNLDAQRQAQYSKLLEVENRLARAKQQVADLNVRAELPGIVQTMDLEPGQQLAMGHSVAKVVNESSMYAEVHIPAIQSQNLMLNQTAVIDTRYGLVAGKVTRIDPAVKQGQVTVDVEIIDPLPKGVRPSQRIDGKIKINDLTNSLFVERPASIRPNQKGHVFVVDHATGKAERRQAEFGVHSARHIQIIAGLAKGDRLVISETHLWADTQTLYLK